LRVVFVERGEQRCLLGRLERAQHGGGVLNLQAVEDRRARSAELGQQAARVVRATRDIACAAASTDTRASTCAASRSPSDSMARAASSGWL